MASIKGTTYKSALYLQLDYSSTQSTSANTSTVSWTLKLYATQNISFSASKAYSVTINGTTYSGNYTSGASGTGSWTIRSGTTTVSHNSDGSKSISVSATFNIAITYSGSSLSSMSLSGTIKLPTIARASTISSTSGSTLGSSMTVNISRASSSFTHTLFYNFGSVDWTTIGTGIATSTTWTPPLSLANQIPNATSGWGTLKLRTFSGSTQIGSDQSTTFTVNVPSSVVPTISSVTLSDAETAVYSQFGGYVKGKSKLTGTISASGVYSSTISSYSTAVGSQGSYSGSPFTSDYLSASGTVNVVTTVTDSRGRTASKTQSITVLDYYSPTVSAFTAHRCDSSGTVDESSGVYVSFTYSYNIASVNSKNTNTYAIQYLNSSGSWVTLKSGTGYSASNVTYVSTATFSEDSDYSFRIVLTDYFSTQYAYASVEPTFTLTNYSSDGTGIGFGGLAEAGYVTFHLPSIFNDPVTMESTLNGYTIGTTDSSANTMCIPTIKSDGGMEVGYYTDYHIDSSNDYDARIIANQVGMLTLLAPSGYTAAFKTSQARFENIRDYDGMSFITIGSDGADIGSVYRTNSRNVTIYGYTIQCNGGAGGLKCNTSWTNVSDRRFKSDIADLDENFIKVWELLQPRMFKWNQPQVESEKWHFGLIAQEVQAAFEEYGLNYEDYGFVSTYVGEDDTTEYLALAYDDYYMINALVTKKLYSRVSALESTLSSLEERLSALENQ